jgi:hypothetical protein
MQKRFLALLILAPALVLTGCGNGNLPTYPIVGSVEFEDGTIPKFGNIEFYSPEFKINARGSIARDGSFTVSTYSDDDGAVAGKHQVVIMQQVGSYLLAKSDSKIKHDHGSLIHPSHFDYRTSGLSCEITPGENAIRFVLKKMPRQTEDGMPHSHAD